MGFKDGRYVSTVQYEEKQCKECQQMEQIPTFREVCGRCFKSDHENRMLKKAQSKL